MIRIFLILLINVSSLYAQELSISDLIEQSVKFESLETQNLWYKLEKESCVKIQNSDQVNRPLFINLQTAIERALLTLDKDSMIWIIHTKLPPTPLRVQDEIPKALIAKE